MNSLELEDLLSEYKSALALIPDSMPNARAALRAKIGDVQSGINYEQNQRLGSLNQYRTQQSPSAFLDPDGQKRMADLRNRRGLIQWQIDSTVGTYHRPELEARLAEIDRQIERIQNGDNAA